MSAVRASGIVAALFCATGASAQFAGPQEALDALVSAVESGDAEAVVSVFGEDARDMLAASPEERAANRATFLSLYEAGYRFAPLGDGAVEVLLGADGWPFAIPVVRGDNGWAFDIEAGREELLAREIGLNELEVIALMDAYGDLQAAFRLTDHDGDGVMEFARSVISSSEARDGLFWPGDGSPVGERLARAAAYGWSDGEDLFEPEPHFGYTFRILQEQGETAPGGAMSYIVNGRMLGGHALLAVPAIYGETGVHSFLVAENGQILEADLGAETTEITAEITAYDPGEVWMPLTQ